MTERSVSTESEKALYKRQNRIIHKARQLLCMELDDCRELARRLTGKASLRSLSISQRWELIEILKEKGADVYNPPLARAYLFPSGGRQEAGVATAEGPGSGDSTASSTHCSHRAARLEEKDRFDSLFSARLAVWSERFPSERAGYASNRQLAWIETLWMLYFNDGRAGNASNGLRGFVFRQTRSLKDGPVGDLTFLCQHQVDAVLLPLKEKARATINQSQRRTQYDE